MAKKKVAEVKRRVRLLVSVLIGRHNHAVGDVFDIAEWKAVELVNAKVAEPVENDVPTTCTADLAVPGAYKLAQAESVEEVEAALQQIAQEHGYVNMDEYVAHADAKGAAFIAEANEARLRAGIREILSTDTLPSFGQLMTDEWCMKLVGVSADEARKKEHWPRIVEVYNAIRAERETRRGRPKAAEELVKQSIYKEISARATFVANVRRIPVHQYLSEVLRPIVTADFIKANEELGS